MDVFRAYLVEKDAAGKARGRVVSLTLDDLPAGDVVIRVAYSSLNYKDALAATGHPGVARKLPHVPGIDAVGIVESSSAAKFRPGDPVIVTGYELGAGAWGGYSEFIRVPADWIVPLPPTLSPIDAMTLGTAGFTAAQSLTAILHQGITPADGDVVVTGASGGVGSLAVAMLAKQGFRVVASSGKPQTVDLLRDLGAAEIIPREAVCDTSDRPLLSARWAAAVDNVGGQTLATLLRSLRERGVVASCGLVGGADLPTTVYPFLLRGVHLAGIASASLPMSPRLEIWRKLAQEWRVDKLTQLRSVIGLDELPQQVENILAGKGIGRTVVTLGGEAATK